MGALTFQYLTSRLTDPARLATPPIAGESGGCQSSYDRRSRYDEETGMYEAWDANNDGDGYIRKEGDSLVVFKQDGPGVIWRVWSALPQAGQIQVFIDGAPTPVIDMPFRGAHSQIYCFGRIGHKCDYRLVIHTILRRETGTKHIEMAGCNAKSQPTRADRKNGIAPERIDHG
jgi:hypothetical protein